MKYDENDSNILHLYLTSFLMHIISENVHLNYLFLSSQLYSDVGRTGIILVLHLCSCRYREYKVSKNQALTLCQILGLFLYL